MDNFRLKNRRIKMYTTSYVREPLIAKIAQRFSLLVTYASTAYVGYLIVQGYTDFSNMITTGWIILVSSLIAALGTLFGYARAEWVAILPLITGVLIAAVSILQESSGFAVGLMVAVCAHSLFRFIHLTIVQSTLRKIYREEAKNQATITN